MEREHGEVEFYLSQALTGHGCYYSYLERTGKREDDECVFCGEADTAEHTIFYCSRWTEERGQLLEQDGERLLPETLVESMLLSPQRWQEIQRVIVSILSQKAEEQKTLQMQSSVG